jgi:purine-cytosine permease-like protein
LTGAADIGVVPLDQRTQSPRDLFLIFAGANIVATTLVTGASLASFGTLARFFWVRTPVDVGALHGAGKGASGPLVRAAAVAWLAGAAAYFAAGSYGETLPSLAAAVSYRLLAPATS